MSLLKSQRLSNGRWRTSVVIGMSPLRFLHRAFSCSLGEPLLPPREHNFNAFARTRSEYVTNVLRNRHDNLRMLQVAYGYFRLGVAATVDKMSVLDFGCAFSPIGQAYATEEGLSPAISSYLGIDIDQQAIDWCQRISALRPEFEYASYNAEHEKYYDTARQGADLLELPAQFDKFSSILGTRKFNLQVSSSVFTHLYMEEFFKFLSAIVPHMGTSAVLFNSVFLVDEDLLDISGCVDARFAKPDRGFTPSPIPGLGSGSYITSPENPRASIGYSKREFFDRLGDFPKVKCEAVLYGGWRGVQYVPLSHNYQDWIVLRRV